MKKREIIDKLNSLYLLIHEEALDSVFGNYKHEDEEKLLLFIKKEDKELYEWIFSLSKKTSKELVDNLYYYYLRVCEVYGVG
jgi:hypothetical protein